MAFDGKTGTSKLAKVIAKRMKEQNRAPLIVDFGEIQGNGSLLTNTFPIPIPKGDYSICKVKQDESVYEPGDRVLVIWVQNEAVVIGLIVNS